MEEDDIRTKVLFYGVWTGKEGGHYLYQPGRPCRNDLLPESLKYPDGTYCRGSPKKGDRREIKTLPEIEGICRINFVDGWTILSFWDRSGVDKRFGCNSNFLAYGHHSFKDMLHLIDINYPNIKQRWKFELILEGMDISSTPTCLLCESNKVGVQFRPTWIVNNDLCCHVHLLDLLRRDGNPNTVIAIR